MKTRAGLSSVVKLLVASLVTVLVAGCTDGSPVGAELRPDGLQVGAVAQAVQSPSPYQAGVYQREIGPEGGTLHFGVGSLTFPRGALSAPTVITARVDGYSIGADFGPEGLQFATDAQPTLRFGLTGSEGAATIVYIDRRKRILTVMPTDLLPEAAIAATRLSHFSPYILAQN